MHLAKLATLESPLGFPLPESGRSFAGELPSGNPTRPPSPQVGTFFVARQLLFKNMDE